MGNQRLSRVRLSPVCCPGSLGHPFAMRTAGLARRLHNQLGDGVWQERGQRARPVDIVKAQH